MEIKTISGSVLFVSTKTSVRAALEEAARAGADLRGADLRGAYLRGADLGGAYLRGADLRGAYLRGAYLGGADLGGADLGGAYLRGADLRGADLRGADLRGAYLGGADLGGADLGGADLGGAYLRGADLGGADLGGAIGAELVIARTRILPDDGAVIGWKKAAKGAIVKLRIPAKAKRSHASGRKCRADRAKVLAIYADGAKIQTAVSSWDKSFVYEVGSTVTPTFPFDEDMWNECASGIHFYITRAEAEAH